MPTIRIVLGRLLGPESALPSLDQKVVQLMESYSWPQNVDTVEAVLRTALQNAKKGRITPECLPSEVRQA